jgi:ubiquitin C-terminal hydrolase
MRPFGLKNTGVICYYNSLMQGLISCPAFISLFDEGPTTITAGIVKHFLQYVKNSDDNIFTIEPILKSVSNGINFGNGQEDASEGFDFFIDKSGPVIGEAFKSEWKTNIFCDNCESITGSGTDTMYRLIMEKTFAPLSLKRSPIEEYMSGHMSKLYDYKCCKCSVKGSGTKVSRIVKTPDIYILSFNKFINKWLVNYPMKITITTFDGRESDYTISAVIHHYGSMSGGHYNTTVYRNGQVYLMDDTNYTPSEFKCTDNDYIVFYSRDKKNHFL